MHRYFKAVIIFAVAAICLFSFTASAEQPAQQGIKFAAYCESVEDINAAVAAGADFVSLGDNIALDSAVSALNAKAALIIDADSIEQADQKLAEVSALNTKADVYYRIDDSASKVTKWAEGKNVKLIGYYKGNIYPIALSVVSTYSKTGDCAIVQMQTNNQDGVILHNSVTSSFAKKGVSGMFSFADSTRSAKRTDGSRSWDDLVSKGYSIIETAYPTDFSEYRNINTVERYKLEASVKAALATSTEGCSPNRVSDYNSALEAAQALLNDGSCATYAMSDSRAVLDEAVKNITIQDGSQIKGDVKFSPGRIAWAIFGVALVLSWQIIFRKRWAKKA